MEIVISGDGSIVTAFLDGEIDHHYAESIRGSIDSAVENRRVKKLILDFKNVSFMDSSGLGMVLGRYKKLAAKKGRLEIINAPRRVERILRMSGVYALLERANGGKRYE